MGVNINCEYCDKFFQCKHPENRGILGWLKLKKECILLGNPLGICDFQKQYARPKLSPKALIPPTNPRRFHIIEDTRGKA